MKNKKGFTLIELLAVIIILGILMIIAIPSVTQYINNSRKSAYVDTAKEIIAGARNRVNQGDLEMFDTEATYYIPASMIGTENGQKSPYGDFTEAYVVVTYDGQGYNYYWISVDETGQGVKNITRLDKLDEDDIESDIKVSDITTLINNTGIGGRKIVNVLKDDNTWRTVTENAENNVSVEGGEAIPEVHYLCTRAETLHTATCSRTSGGCYDAGYYVGGSKNTTTITYGNDPTTRTIGTLKPGDAFDCDVNSNGIIDTVDGKSIERFYYMTYQGSGDNKRAVLLYYTNVTSGTTPTRSANYAYDSSDVNYYGPRTAYLQLPTTTQWSNDLIVLPESRQIKNEKGTTISGSDTLQQFTYTDKAARFLTFNEVESACNIWLGDSEFGELDRCNYVMENLGLYESTGGSNGYWLETVQKDYSINVWYVNGGARFVHNYHASDSVNLGVRPVIEVLISNIDY